MDSTAWNGDIACRARRATMIFVLEIKGAAILAFEADDMDDARAYAGNAEEREDLTELTSNGQPLWNGKDEIAVRQATDAEADLFEE